MADDQAGLYVLKRIISRAISESDANAGFVSSNRMYYGKELNGLNCAWGGLSSRYLDSLTSTLPENKMVKNGF